MGKASWAPPLRVCVKARLPGGGGGPKCTCPDGLQLTSAELEGCPGKGLRPAHWLLPDLPDSQCCWAGAPCCKTTCTGGHAEVDIMEMLNSDGVLHGTYITGPNCGPETIAKSGFKFVGDSWGETDHEFSVELGTDHVAFALDGEVYTNLSKAAHTVENGGSWANYSNTEASGFWPRWRYYVLLNTALGFQPGNANNPDAHTQLPALHSIDYVRVMRRL
eukprot:SAG22_NODE_257_length_13543_cov_26.100417_12_plen_219_part_00